MVNLASGLLLLSDSAPPGAGANGAPRLPGLTVILPLYMSSFAFRLTAAQVSQFQLELALHA
jgi:hypothetical protein